MGNSRFRFRVWDKVSKRYFYLELKFGDNGYHPDFITDPVFEQCTGLKDKNGNLIYEGDLIKSPNNSNGLVVYYDITGLWRCKEKRENGMWELPLYDLVRNYGVEIIGNIHEQAEQKENAK